MEKWEHKTVELGPFWGSSGWEYPSQEDILNREGQDGWELVSVINKDPNDTANQKIAYFKRKIKS